MTTKNPYRDSWAPEWAATAHGSMAWSQPAVLFSPLPPLAAGMPSVIFAMPGRMVPSSQRQVQDCSPAVPLRLLGSTSLLWS